MTGEELVREFGSLPPEAQRQIEDLVAMLRARYRVISPDSVPGSDLESEPFIGMWRDRTEMNDSSTWVRGVRETHWSK
jgi:hypothetical protein